MKIRMATNDDQYLWNKFIQSQREASFYHLYEWAIAASLSLQLTPFMLSAWENKKIIGVLPLFFKRGVLGSKRLTTLPFGDYSGPVGLQFAQETLITEALKLTNRLNSSLELVTNNKMAALPNQLAQQEKFIYYELRTDVDFETVLKSNVHKKTRNMVKKAEKSGIVVSVEDSVNSEDFYHLYLQTMRKLGVIPIPFTVYQNTAKCLENKTLLFKATLKARNIGYLWTFLDNGVLWVWANATDERYLGFGTNYALYATALKTACERRDITIINFGSSSPGSPQAFFKSRWGGEEKPLYSISSESVTYTERQKTQQHLKPVITHLPLPLLSLTGKLAYKLY